MAAYRWQKGQSGNPKGRPSVAEVSNIRAQFREHLPVVVDKVIELALSGDLTAIKLILDRCVPVLRSVEAPTQFVVPLEQPHQAVASAVLAGTITAPQATAWLRLYLVSKVEAGQLSMEQLLQHLQTEIDFPIPSVETVKIDAQLITPSSSDQSH